MELKKIKEDKNTLLLEIGKETMTITNALREELWNDSNVIEAAQIREHPYLSEPKIFVKMTKDSSKLAIEKAAKRISKKSKEFEDEFNKSIK